MDYLNDIKKIIRILIRSQKFHLLCISGAPGWAKTHTTRQFLSELGTKYRMLGAYSTAIALYKLLTGASTNFLDIRPVPFLFFYYPLYFKILSFISKSR
jgi:hypothetical protein